jgi:hypothetical protein
MAVCWGLILIYVDIDMPSDCFLLTEFRFFEADRGSENHQVQGDFSAGYLGMTFLLSNVLH